MVKNEIITLTVTGVTSDGAGVGRFDGMAVFVRGTAPGDVAEVIVIKVTKSYAVGKLSRLLTEAPCRIQNDCKAFPRCGGCVFRHISYDEECRIKRDRVQDCLRRIGDCDVEVGMTEFGESYGYRNKAEYPVVSTGAGFDIGFYAQHSHRIINQRECALQPDEFARIIPVIEQYLIKNSITAYDEATGKGVIRHIYLRKAEATEEIMVCPVINANRLPNTDMLINGLKRELGNRLKTVVLNINKSDSNVILSDKCITVYGDGYITDLLCGIKVRLNALSFYQVNRSMAQRLYKKAAELAGTGKLLIDLYCGAGTIGMTMAKQFDKIIGVEIIPEAIADAKFNAVINGISNAQFICADAYEAAKQLSEQNLHPDTVIVDPPRKGLEAGLPRHIAESMSPARIVYVSCDPATLARDVKAFSECGYKAVSATPFDLFPRTSHVESVVLMSRA